MDQPGLDGGYRTSQGHSPWHSDPLVEWLRTNGCAFEHSRDRPLVNSAEATPVYLLQKGWVLRTRVLNDDREGTVATYIPGDIINLDCIAEPGTHDMLQPLTKVSGFRVSCNDLRLAMRESVDLAFAAIKRFVAETDWLREALAAVNQLAADERLIVFVAQTRRRMIAYGALDPAETDIRLPLTQSQLGQTIGVTSVHANRIVQKLRQEGVLNIMGRTASIPDLRAFESRADAICYANNGAG